MNINLKFNGNVGVFSTPTFDISDNDDMTINIGLEGVKSQIGAFSLLAELNGQQLKFALAGKRNEEVTFPAEWLRTVGAGELKLQLIQFNATRTAEINRGLYHIEPLMITDVQGGGFLATAVFSNALNRICLLEKRNEELIKLLKGINKRLKFCEKFVKGD